jgi:hypothetical protein
VSHRGGPDSCPGQSMWDLWWDRFFPEFFSFPLSVSFHRGGINNKPRWYQFRDFVLLQRHEQQQQQVYNNINFLLFSLLGISSLLRFSSTKYSNKNACNVNKLNNTNRNFYWEIHSSLLVVPSTLNPYFSILHLISSTDDPRVCLSFSYLLILIFLTCLITPVTVEFYLTH